MNLDELVSQYDFRDRVIAVTGGAGTLCSEMVCALAGCNGNVAVIDRDVAQTERLLKRGGIRREHVMVLEGS